MTRNLLFSIATFAALSIVASPAMAQFDSGNSANNLFSQYYTQPGASQVQAGMYPAPHYVPANVGHTYYTYQPVMPHEMMYHHSRNYFNYYNTGGYVDGCDALNRTQVKWYSGANHMRPMPLQGLGAQQLIWRVQKRRYGLKCDSDGQRGCFRRAGGECESVDCAGSVDGECASGTCAKNGSGQSIRR